jgi:hypothetical protein
MPVQCICRAVPYIAAKKQVLGRNHPGFVNSDEGSDPTAVHTTFRIVRPMLTTTSTQATCHYKYQHFLTDNSEIHLFSFLFKENQQLYHKSPSYAFAS